MKKRTKEYRKEVRKAFEKGSLIEYSPKGYDDYKLLHFRSKVSIFDWDIFDYKIAEPELGWLGTLFNTNESCAMQAAKWLGIEERFE